MRHALLTRSLLLSACMIGHAAESTTQPGGQAFTITCPKKGDAVKVAVEGQRVILDITSARGIGGATIGRSADHWPAELVLRVHLRGLEALTVAGADLKLEASVASHSGHPKSLVLWKEGKDGPQPLKVDPAAAIQIFDAAGKPVAGLPPEGGYFQIVLPKALLADAVRQLRLEWVDFYR